MGKFEKLKRHQMQKQFEKAQEAATPTNAYSSSSYNVRPSFPYGSSFPTTSYPLGTAPSATNPQGQQQLPVSGIAGMQELAEAMNLQPTEETGVGVVLQAEDGNCYSLTDIMLAFVRFFASYKSCPECQDIFKTDEDDYICKRCRHDAT